MCVGDWIDMTANYRICTKCVMDTTDTNIQFDENGICNHCREYEIIAKKNEIVGNGKRQKLEMILNDIKREGINKKYDCIIGVSGGVDSTFVAYKVKEFGLRPLAVHLDNGWNSEIAVNNIYKALNKLNVDLHTYVIDWEEFKDIQLSFLKASTPDSEIPTDHAIFSLMNEMAGKIGVSYVITGCNYRTESHLPVAWSQGQRDWKYIKSVHKQFGKIKIRTFPYSDFWDCHRYSKILKRIDILDYLDYVKKDAVQVLEQEIGWRYYGGKHCESIYTRFFQGYILPKKFGYDKRKAHFSSLICSGEMTREEALQSLKKEIYPIKGFGSLSASAGIIPSRLGYI